MAKNNTGDITTSFSGMAILTRDVNKDALASAGATLKLTEVNDRHGKFAYTSSDTK